MARIKTNLVVAEIEAMKIANLELKAPIGVDVDLKTGELTEIVRVEPIGDPVLRPTIIPGKLVNVGFLKATLIVEPEDMQTPIYLPIFSVTKIDGIKPGDEIVEVAKLEHISISGLPDVVPLGHSGYNVKIYVRALLKVLITVTREEIVSLPEDDHPNPPRYSSGNAARSKGTASNKRKPANGLSRDYIWNKYWAYMHR